MKERSFRLLPGILLLILLLAIGVSGMPDAHAQAESPSLPASGNTAADKDRIIADLLRRVEALERQVANTSSARPAAAPAASAGQVATPAAPAAANKSSPPQRSATPSAPTPPSAATGTGTTSSANEPAGEETSRALERSLIREGALVLPAKTFEIEPRLTYQFRSSNEVRIITSGGQAQVAQQDLKNYATEAALGLRAGLPWATQLEIALPYDVGRERRVIIGGSDQTDRTSGFGNFGIGVTKQILTETKGSPGVLASLRWLRAGPQENFSNPAALANSFSSLQAGLTVVKRQDPLVFFGSFAYAVNYSRTINGSTIEPGNSTGVKLGSIFAVSPDTSMRLGFELSRSAQSSVNGVTVAGSNAVTALFDTGFSFVLSPKTLLSIETGFGLTSSSPDFRVGVSLPIRF